MPHAPALLVLREDFRFHDNPAMRAAADSGRPVVCLYVFQSEGPDHQVMGGAQRWWLHHSLAAFQADLETRNGALILRRGDPADIVPAMAEEIGAAEVFWTRRYMGWQVEADKALKTTLEEAGRSVHSVNGRLLFEPWEISTKTGGNYRVFTPYWKQIRDQREVRGTVARVDKLAAPSDLPPSDSLAEWDLLPTKPDWSGGFGPRWTPGEQGARARLRDWLAASAAAYDEERNRPDLDTTSRLSPHLHFGEISPVEIWHQVQASMVDGSIPQDQGHSYLSEIVWREFSYQLLFHQPWMHDAPMAEKFKDFQWNDDPNGLTAWQTGQTGFPIVDAGMRQLWQEGWMHNRVRMIVGSFLVKDLLLDWRHGMAWFWDTLVDADPASNTASWQWVAGCGADAAPFFRVFNPTSQGEKFDPDGTYVRKYVPELADLPKKHIHAPEKAPAEVLRKAGIELGVTYPAPLVDHSARRTEALSRYQAIK